MTRKFATEPLLLGTTALANGKRTPKHIPLAGSQYPNRASVTGGMPIVGGLDNVGGNAYSQMATIGDWAEWDVILPANDPGMYWAIGVHFWRSTNSGIVTVKVDGILSATIDTYRAAGTLRANAYFVAVGGVTPSLQTTRPKKSTIRLDLTGKNASSSAAFIVFLGAIMYQFTP